MKKILSILLSVILSISMLSGCSEKITHSNSNQNEKRTLKIGTWKTAQTIQPYFYDKYIDNMYNVEVLPFTNPGDQKTALLSKSLDFCGTTLVTAIIAASNDEPIKIVASLCNKCSALVVSKKSGIQSEKDLKGKTIAYVPGTMHHILLLDVLRKNGLDPDKDVTLKRIDFFDMGQALKDGTIDAFCSGEPYPSQAIEEGYGIMLSHPYFDDSIGEINAAMITTEDMINNHPDIVQELVTAQIESSNYLNNNKEKWIDAAVQFGNSKDVLEVAVNNMELSADIDDEYIAHTKKLAEKMFEMGIIKKIPDIDKLFDRSFLVNSDYEK